jgi:oleate hydratase
MPIRTKKSLESAWLLHVEVHPMHGRGEGKAYLVGGGIAALAAAVYLIRDGRMPGSSVHLLCEGEVGGSLDASGSAETGYVMRGSRMYGAAYVLSYDLLAGIPSLNDQDKSVLEDTLEFWEASSWDAKARLIESGGIVDLSSWGFEDADRVDLMRLMLFPEEDLGSKPISGCFQPHFFSTNFWFMWASMFGFETWHSAAELRRYLLRFLRLFPDLETMNIIQTTRYNGRDSIIRPLLDWLIRQGAQIETGVRVTDLVFTDSGTGKRVAQIECLRNGEADALTVAPEDLVIATLGSLVADSRFGAMDTAPELEKGKVDGAWSLWQRLEEKDPAFGRPGAFCEHVDDTKWVTFTVTDSSDRFASRMEAFSGSKPGRGGLATLISSNWMVTLHLFHPPAYPDQPDGTFVWWGYGLYPDRVGNFVEKPMTVCSGREILTEVYSHLGFDEDMTSLLEAANCIPCMLPYTTSQFMPREPGDRPEVIPAGTENLAFVGQFVEIPDDVVYTTEYSIHSARLAVTGLLELPDEIPPAYRGLEHPWALTQALKRILA